MTPITDEYMQQMLMKTKEYCFVLLKPVSNPPQADFKKILWEHGRRNFQLRAGGLLSIVAPITIEADVAGIGIFNATAEETKKLLEEDPAVQAGVFTYHIYPCRSFPGDSLPQ